MRENCAPEKSVYEPVLDPAAKRRHSLAPDVSPAEAGGKIERVRKDGTRPPYALQPGDAACYTTSIFAFARNCFARFERSFSYLLFCKSSFRSFLTSASGFLRAPV